MSSPIPVSIPNPVPIKSLTPGFKLMIIGDSGAGKTYSLRTAINTGLEVRAIFTEPHARLTVGDIPCSKGLHWVYAPPSTGSWDEMLQKAKIMTSMSWSAISKMTEDPKKSSYTGFWKILSALHNFKCDRCGEEFGDASDWGTSTILVLDSLSGLNAAAMQMVAGSPVARSQPQWGAAMEGELMLVNKICMDTYCHVALLAHADRQVDELSSISTIVPLSLGKANRGEFPKNFSDIIWAYRVAKDFFWSTANPSVNCLKATHLPIEDKLLPDFKLILSNWQTRGGIIEKP